MNVSAAVYKACDIASLFVERDLPRSWLERQLCDLGFYDVEVVIHRDAFFSLSSHSYLIASDKATKVYAKWNGNRFELA